MSYRSKYTGVEVEEALERAKAAATKNDLAAKQDYLRSGENIKTINGQSILGSGNIEIQGGGAVTAYTAFINLITPNFNAVLKDTTGHYIEFTFDTKNESGSSLGESVTCTYTIVRGSSKKTVTERYRYNTHVKFNVDKYLQEGANDITIKIVGNISNATTAVGLAYQVVNLQLTTDYDISTMYNLLTTPQAVAEIPFTVSGYGTKTVEWYLDGNKIASEQSVDEVTGTSATRTKRISVANLSQGKHSIQLRAYTVIDGETFYTDTLYRDVIIYTGANTSPIIAVAATIPSGTILKGDLELSGAVQYIPYMIDFAVYNPLQSSVQTIVKVDGVQQASVTAVSGIVNTFSYIPMTAGNKTITINAGTSAYIIPIKVGENDNTLEEITDQLELDLQAVGKTNTSTDKDVWTYGNYKTTFNGFKWNTLSGWNDGALVMGDGDSISVDIQPLKADATTTGKTMEFEFSTSGVMNDDAVVCDLRDSSGTGILITASKVSIVSAGGKVLSRPFKSEDNIRVGFVINKDSGVDNKGLAFVYVNGIVSGSVNFSETDNFMSTTYLSFAGSEEASVILRSLRFYNAALTHDQMLNNYILYRRSVSEMMDVYNRNDIYEEGTENLSAERLANQLPVLIVTGDIPALEDTTDKNKSIVVDVEYINYQNPRLSFTMKNAHMQPQGTSSMGYPKKNFRLYSQKRDDTILYNAEGVEVADRLYAFKEGSAPVNCWCFKADFAESSGTHNTGIARIWNDSLKNMKVDEEFVGRTQAQQAAMDNAYPYDVRTTIDGFPILMFYRLNDTSETVFIGKYNFNNDKETERVFGFVDIPGFNNARMQCWEVLNNGNHLALFQDTTNFDSEWTDAFESRYPDTKTPDVTDLKAFAVWLTTTTDFATEKWQHLDVYKVAAYYVYVMRFGAVDQMVKNAMFTSEDGQKFYYINYDNDTINGLRNDGYLVYPPTITRQTLDETYDTEVYAYAGHDSRLWNYLEADAEFMTIVQNVDAALYNAGLTYANVIKMFDEEQSSKWCERIYNRDAQYKYVIPYVEKGVNNLFMLQGSRESHRRWWLSKRFAFVDSLFVSGEYKSNVIEAKLANAPIGVNFKIKAGVDGNYGYGVNNVPISYGIALDNNQEHTFTTVQVLNIGDPLRIYAAPSLAEVDLSNFIQYMSTLNLDGVYTSTLGTKLKVLKLGVDSATDNRRNTSLNLISGLGNASKLELINIEGYKAMTSLDLSGLVNLNTLEAYASGLTSVSLPDGSPIELVELPNTMQGIVLSGANKLTAQNLKIEGGWNNISVINIKKCPSLTSDWNIIKNWYASKNTEDMKCSLTMEGIEWNNVSAVDLIALGNIKTSGGVLSLKGTINLGDTRRAQIDEIKSIYGEYVFEIGGELTITAPECVIIEGVADVLDGDSLQLLAEVVSGRAGTLSWSIVSGSNASISNNGLLTTTETGTQRNIVVRATYNIEGSTPITKEETVKVNKRVYPANATIDGNINPIDSNTYTWSTSTSGVNGIYTATWELSGDITEYFQVKSVGNESCVLEMTFMPLGTINGTLKLTIKKKYNNTVAATATKSLAAYNADVIITSRSNAPIQASLYGAGLVANETYTLKSEAEKITGTQLQSGTTGDTTIFASQKSNITSFNEFKYFTKITTVPQGLFYGFDKLKSIEIPSTTTILDDDVFYNCSSLTSVVLPEGLKTIEVDCFRNCSSLAALDMPDTITRIGGMAFSYCTALKSVTLPKGLSTILSQVFQYCSALETVVIQDGITQIYGSCFRGCTSLKSVSLPNSLVTISATAFQNCTSLKSISIPESSSNISTTAFQGIHELDFTVDANNATYSSVDGVLFNKNKTKIVTFAKGKTQPSYTIPSGVTTIGENAFRVQTNLTSIVIPSSVTTIEATAFNGCTYLTSIQSLATSAPSVYSDSFGTSTSSYTGYKKKGSNKLYVSLNATGYEASYWLDPLQDASKCGFNINGKIVVSSNYSSAKFDVTYTTEANASKTVNIGVGTSYLSDIKSGSSVSIKVTSSGTYDWTTKSLTYTFGEALSVSNSIYAPLTLSILSNQSSDTTINSVKATVAYGSTSTQMSNGQTVNLPINTSVTVTYPAVNGYTTPAAQTFTTGTSAISKSGTYNTTIVKVVMADNQTAYDDIASATATIAASGMTTATVSSNGTAKVPTGASCTITWSAVSGYKTPDKQTFTTSGTSVTKTGTYQTEILTVTVTSDIELPASYTITVSGIGSQTTASKVYKVPFGTSYTISASAASGYTTPDTQTFTANSASRLVNIQYLEYVIPVTTIRIDQTISDPASMITSVEDNGHVNLIRNRTHRYLGKCTSEGTMTVCQLDDSSNDYFAYGGNREFSSDPSGTHGDLFVWIPKFYYKIAKVKTDIYDVSFYIGEEIMDSSWKVWEGNTLIGVRQAVAVDSKLRSVDINLDSSQKYTFEQLWELSKNRGEYFSIAAFEHYNLLTMLFFAYYKHTDAIAILGDGVENNVFSGSTYDYGMNDTQAETLPSGKRTNFWGVESLIGGQQEMVRQRVKCEHKYSDADKAWIDKITYIGLDGKTYSTSYTNKNHFLSKISFENGFLPIATDASSTTGYCSCIYISDYGDDIYAFKNVDILSERAGLASIYCVEPYAAYNFKRARLTFTGNIIEEINPTVFESLTAII